MTPGTTTSGNPTGDPRVGFVITIDGPSGAGKSTTARAVAVRLAIPFLDTGALYRAVAWKVIEEGVTPTDEVAVASCADHVQLHIAGAAHDTHVFVNSRDVSREIRTPEVSELSSRLAVQPLLRRRLVEVQREIGRRGPVVAEGRDVGTVVFPDAPVKVLLDADLDTRARRRARERQNRGIAMSLEDVRDDLARRDQRDRTRADSPLQRAPDAIVVDTTGMTLDTQVEAVLGVVRAHPASPEAWKSATREGA
jgi:cytidylate kinase